MRRRVLVLRLIVRYLCRRASSLAAVSSEEISAKVAELTTMRETIEKKQAHIERQSTLIAQQAIARSKLGDKRGALLLVKKKKMHDVEAQKFNGSAYPSTWLFPLVLRMPFVRGAVIGHLDKQIGVLSNAQLNSQFMATMVGSQAAIAQIQKGVNLESKCSWKPQSVVPVQYTPCPLAAVEDVRDKFEEQMEDHKAGGWRACFMLPKLMAKWSILACAVSDMLGEEWGPPVASDVDLAAELAELEEMDFGEYGP